MAKGNKISQTLVWILLGLLFVGLAGFGATNFGGSQQRLGRVGDAEITVNAYVNAVQQDIQNLARQTGQRLTIAQAQQLGLTEASLARVVGEAALTDAVTKAGVSVGDEAVRNRVLEVPAFRSLDGDFDRAAYEQTLRQNGLTIGEFETQIRNEASRSLLQAAVVGGVVAPSEYVDTLYNWAREGRDVTWARLTAADLDAPIPEPGEDQLAAFHSDNPEQFELGETRAITYAWLTPEMIAGTIETDDAALRALYDERIDFYVQPERRLVERLVFADDAAAEAAKAAIEAGETTFDALVSDRGLELSDVDLGDVRPEDLGDAAEAVFALTEPGIAGPAPTPLGPALFRMNGILAATETTFEDARDDLARQQTQEEAVRLIQDMFDEIDDLLAGGATIEDIATETELELGQIDWRPDVSDDIAVYTSFAQAAARARTEDFPELIELEDGGIFTFRLDEIRPPALPPLEDVREDVAAAWLEAETETRLMAMATPLADRFRSGGDMAVLGQALNIETGLRRDGFLEGTPPDFVDTVFEMALDDVEVVSSEGDVWIVRLDRIAAPDASDLAGEALRTGFADRAAQDFANDLLQAFTRSVQATAGIEINQATLNAIHTHLN